MVMKHYPPEFRAEAVALYRSRPGATIKSVAQDLGVNHETLRNWIRLDDAQRTEAPATTTASASATASPEDENAALRRRIRELEEERDILRKAARYFAGETRW
ncbi:transposase [Saccharothrix sp. NRRL B-16348]|nr:transposase [Saccharothrix sp. NRRL B-16348]